MNLGNYAREPKETTVPGQPGEFMIYDLGQSCGSQLLGFSQIIKHKILNH